MSELESATGAVALHSKFPFRIEFSAPLDWVTTDRLLTATKLSEADEKKSKGIRHRLLFVSCCDSSSTRSPARGRRKASGRCGGHRVGPDGRRDSREGAAAFLRKEYPLFAGRLDDIELLEVALFGVSAVGGDFEDPVFKEAVPQWRGHGLCHDRGRKGACR